MKKTALVLAAMLAAAPPLRAEVDIIQFGGGDSIKDAQGQI
jgi:hypothetical protein